MSTLIPFDFESHALRVLVDDNGEPLFVAKDVAVALGYKDTTNAIKQHCRGVVKHHPIKDSQGRDQNARVIQEPDLYRLIAGSTLPAAQEFERKVFEEILPTIRKTGRYDARPAANDSGISALKLTRIAMGAARAFGFTGNQAILSADHAVQTITGTSPLLLMGVTHLTADPRGRTYTPTELGKAVRPDTLSAIKLNQLLEAKGMQLRDIHNGWQPTESATGHFEWMDTGKRHSSGAPVKQLKWFVSVLDAIGVQYQMEDAA